MSSVWVASRTIACCKAVSRSFSAWMSRPTDCSSISPVIGERTICAFQLHQRLPPSGSPHCISTAFTDPMVSRVRTRSRVSSSFGGSRKSLSR